MAQGGVGTFTPGTKVQYWSASKKEWIVAKVLEINEDGSYKLNCKSHAKTEHMRHIETSAHKAVTPAVDPPKGGSQAEVARPAPHLNGVTARRSDLDAGEPEAEPIAKVVDDSAHRAHAQVPDRRSSRSRDAPVRHSFASGRSPPRRRLSPSRQRGASRSRSLRRARSRDRREASASPVRGAQALPRRSLSPPLREQPRLRSPLRQPCRGSPVRQSSRARSPLQQPARARSPLRQPSRARSPLRQPSPRARSPIRQPSRARSPLRQPSRGRSPLRQPSRARSPPRQSSRDRSLQRQPSRARSPRQSSRARSRSPLRPPSRARSPVRQSSRARSPVRPKSGARSPPRQPSRARSPPRQSSRARSGSRPARKRSSSRDKDRKKEPERRHRSRSHKRSRSRRPRSRDRDRERKQDRDRDRDRRERDRERERERERRRSRSGRDNRHRSRDRRSRGRRSRSRRDRRDREPSRRRGASRRRSRSRRPARGGRPDEEGERKGWGKGRHRSPAGGKNWDRSGGDAERQAPPPASTSELAPLPPGLARVMGETPQVEMCGDFKRGKCTRGDRCRYSHGEASGTPGGADGADEKGGKGKSKGKPGDWKCAACGANVFASKRECFKCGAPKPPDMPDQPQPLQAVDAGGLQSFAFNTVSPGGIAPSAGGIPPAPDRFSAELWEQPREQVKLRLVSEDVILPGVNWQYVLNDGSRRSFAAYHSSPFSQEQTKIFFDTVKEGVNWTQPMGPVGPIPRKTCWLVASGCSCTYRYGQIEVDPQEYPPWMVKLMTIVMPLFGAPTPDKWPNGCNINLYEDGGASVGWHSDDERLFQGKFQDIRIFSLSLGQRRKFELRVNYPEQGEKAVKMMHLGDGDLMTMEGMLQKHYMHRVPKEGNVDSPRINLTWRWVAKHSPKCPASRMRQYNPSYGGPVPGS